MLKFLNSLSFLAAFVACLFVFGLTIAKLAGIWWGWVS